MDKFVSSEGIEVRISEGGYMTAAKFVEGIEHTAVHARITPRGIRALKEFFQAKRDAELGVWRYAREGKPDLLVRPLKTAGVAVYSERDPQNNKVFASAAEATGDGSLARAARAYWKAHPDRAPKPWTSAKPGELWELMLSGDPAPTLALVTKDGNFSTDDQDLFSAPAGFIIIKSGRRLYP